MISSKLLMPSHLSIFVTDPDNGNPVAYLPLYAEVAVPRIVPIPPVNEIFRENLQGTVTNFRLPNPQYVIDTALKALGASIAPDGLHQLENDSDRAVELFTAMLEEVEEIRTATNREHISDIPPYELRSLMIAAFRRIGNEIGLGLVPENKEQEIIWANPLGVLTTDHVGYASFDLKSLHPEVQIMLIEAIEARRNNPNVDSRVAIWIHPYGYDGKFDALSQARFAFDAVVARLPVKAYALPPALVNLGPRALQNPSLTDWRLSPASFAANPTLLLGEDGGEELLPATNALQEFVLRQVVRVTNPPANVNIPSAYKFAYVDDYRVSWFSLGHSLGEILYSLPLAPAETVKLAVIDWSWDSLTKRDEQTKLTEDVLHQTHRDRTITETVRAGIKEFQKGSSFMGGIALSAGITGAFDPISLAIGSSSSLGGSTATSKGSRELAAENVQRLMDSFSQASSAQREINSTVVVHARQEEKESIQTRTFTNYNHSHTLTILYYEVLRHFRVTVEWIRRRQAVLVKLDDKIFEGDTADETVRENRAILQRVLIDQKYTETFDALDRIFFRKTVNDILNPAPQVTQLTFVRFEMKTGGIVLSGDKGLTVKAILYPIDKELNNGDRLNPPGGFTEENTYNTFAVAFGEVVSFNDIDQIVLVIDIHNNTSGPDISFQHIRVVGIDVFGNEIPLVDMDYAAKGGHLILGAAHTPLTLPTFRPQPAPPRPIEEIEDEAKKRQLLAHLNHHKNYYAAAIQFGQTPEDRAQKLARKPWSNQNSTLIDYIDPEPLQTFGSYMAYPLAKQESPTNDLLVVEVAAALNNNDPARRLWAIEQLATMNEEERKQIERISTRSERLITLPTRGVFAEGKLGHNNVSEVIDDDRFWKWEEHPIPFEAPDINPVTPIQPQPQQISAAPTAFPPSLVNIVNPTAAPDPNGLSAALSLLGNPNIFRDMSGRAEVADLLKKLVEESVDITEAANRAREIQTKYGAELDKHEKDLQARIIEAHTRPTSTPTPSEQQTAVQKEKQHLENQVKKLEIASKMPKKPHRDIIRNHVTQEVTKQKTTWTILFSSHWVGEIGQPMLASYSAKVVFGALVDDVHNTGEQYTDEQIVLQVEHEKVPLSATFYAKQITPIDGSFQVAVPGMTVEGMQLIPKNYSIPLRANAPKLPEEVKYTVTKIQADPKSPVLHFKGTATLKPKTFKIAVKVTGEGELTGEWGRDFEREATIEIVKLAVKSSLKSATRIMIGGEAGIEGTFEILYLESYEVKQITTL